MSTVHYSFAASSSSCSATSPFTLVLDPSGINVGTGYISKIVYRFPDKTVTKSYTFSSSADALTVLKEFDSRAPVTYTFPGSAVSNLNSTMYVVTVSATIAPSFTTNVYILSAYPLLQFLTKNPISASNPYAFEEIHLLKTRVWGAGDSQLFILETKNPNYILINFSDQPDKLTPTAIYTTAASSGY